MIVEAKGSVPGDADSDDFGRGREEGRQAVRQAGRRAVAAAAADISTRGRARLSRPRQLEDGVQVNVLF